MSHKARTLTKGSILRMAEFFSVAVVTFLMTPFIIGSLGDSMYGIWIFVGSFLGYYGLMDFGLSSAMQRLLSRAVGANDPDEANKVINTAFLVYFVIGLSVFVISIVVAAVVPGLIKNIGEVGVFRKVVVILGLSFAIGFPLRVFFGILVSNLRYDLIVIVELVKLAARSILIIVYLKSGHGIVSMAWIMLATEIGGNCANILAVRHLFKNNVFSARLFAPGKVRELFGYSFYTFIAQIADQLRFNIDNLVIITFIGLGSVTVYSIAFRLIKYFMQFISAGVGIFMPVFSQYEAAGDYVSIREKLIFTTKISAYLSVLTGGILILFGKAFIHIWVGAAYLPAYPVLVVLTIPIVIALMQNPSLQVIYGLSKHRYVAVVSSVEGVVNLVLSVMLVGKMGLIGVALGTAIPMIIVNVFIYPRYVCRLVGLPVSKYYYHVLAPVLVKGTLIVAVFGSILKNRMISGYAEMAVMVLALVVVFGALCTWLGFDRLERGHFRKLIFKYG
ncbi:MAG: oligosaccharide flippase family protein [Candidatus Omnitrophica bacterium]|nr:oligosaccharide flippase family protein [Candidatus Omnitrophota bacterium]